MNRNSFLKSLIFLPFALLTVNKTEDEVDYSKIIQPSTLQSSNLELLNERKLILKIQSDIESILEDFMIELNDSQTRSVVSSVINSYLSIFDKQIITYYKVICDETNNTIDVIDNNHLCVGIILNTKILKNVKMEFTL